jgi:hypothetical protein
MADEVNADIHDEHKHISFFGYFGKSSISDHLNVPNQIPFDFMHLVLQGHAKWIYNKLTSDRSLIEDSVTFVLRMHINLSTLSIVCN